MLVDAYRGCHDAHGLVLQAICFYCLNSSSTYSCVARVEGSWQHVENVEGLGPAWRQRRAEHRDLRQHERVRRRGGRNGNFSTISLYWSSDDSRTPSS